MEGGDGVFQTINQRQKNTAYEEGIAVNIFISFLYIFLPDRSAVSAVATTTGVRALKHGARHLHDNASRLRFSLNALILSPRLIHGTNEKLRGPYIYKVRKNKIKTFLSNAGDNNFSRVSSF